MSIRNRRSIPNKIPAVSHKSALLRHPFPNEPNAQVYLEDDESVNLQHFQHSPNWEYCCKCRENCPEVSSHECSSLSMTNSTVRETSSTSSWTDDECEQSATRNVRCMLDELEEILYDSTETCDNESLVAESLHWKKHFPHFRIVGKKLVTSSESLSDEFSCMPSTSFIHDIMDSDYTNTIPDLCLQIQGVALNSVHPAEENASSEISNLSPEEIIVQDGFYEELIAVDNSDDLIDTLSIATNTNEISDQQVDKTTCDLEFEEKILNILIGQIWNQVVSRIQAFLIHKEQYKSDILGLDLTEDYTPIRINREISSAAVSQFYPPTQPADLQGILQVSSKVLMNRVDVQKTRVASSRITRGQNVSAMQQATWTNYKGSSSGRLAPLQQTQRVIMSASVSKDPKCAMPISSSWGRNATLPPIDTVDLAPKAANTAIIKATSPRFSSALLELPNCSIGERKGANAAGHGLQSNVSATIPTSSVNISRHIINKNNFEKAEMTLRDLLSSRLNSSPRLGLRSTGMLRLASVRSPSARKKSASQKNTNSAHLSVQNFLLDKQ